MAWPKEIPGQRYPSDWTDEEWEILEPILKKPILIRPVGHVKSISAKYYSAPIPVVKFPLLG